MNPVRKSATMLEVEARVGKPLEAWLLEGLSAGRLQSEMALEAGVSRATMRYWVMLFRVDRDTSYHIGPPRDQSN